MATAFAFVLVMASLGATPLRSFAAPPAETEKVTEGDGAGPAGPTGGPYVEPKLRHAKEAEAVLKAYQGEPFSDPPESTAVADAIAAIQGQTPPESEVFALVKVTDRHTGERRFFTRGEPTPGMAAAVADPDLAPTGFGYLEAEEAIANDDVEVVTRSIHLHATGTRQPRNRDNEEKRRLKRQAKGSPVPWRLDGDLRARVIAGKIDLGKSRMLGVRIQMAGVPALDLPKVNASVIDGLLWIGLDVQAEREQAIIERKQAMANAQADLIAAIENAGGQARYASWTGGVINARVPQSAIPALAERGDVLSIDIQGKPRLEGGFQGDDIFAATDSENLDAFHDGNAAAPSGKHAWTSDIVIAQSEACIDEANPAFLDTAGGSARALFFDCDVQPCTLGSLESCPFATSDEKHGTKVAGRMLADFMQGQDPNVLPPDDRLMTGTCPECRLLFAQDSNNNDREAAMDFFCEQGADLFESSVAEGTSCDGNGSFDASIEALADCDIVFVKGVGNDGSTTGACTVRYPADHPWTFAVAGADTTTPCDTAAEYYTSTCDFDDGSSMGGGLYNYVGVGTASIVDIAGPFRHGGLIEPGTANPVQYVEGAGNSYATPTVAGLMAELMDWYHTHVSDSIFFSNRMRNFMLLMGDRSIDDAGTSRAGNFHDPRWGSGRVGLVPFDDKGTWSVHRTSAVLGSGDSTTIRINVPSGATFLKAVVWHDGTDYFEEPMIHLELDPVDCATATKSVNRRDSKAMLVYNSTPLSGCTQIDVTIENIKDGVFLPERRFHFAAYSDTEDERHF